MASGKGAFRIAVEDWVKHYSVPQETRDRFRGWLDKQEYDTYALLDRTLVKIGVPGNLRDLMISTLATPNRGDAPQLIIAALGMIVAAILGSFMGFSAPIRRATEQAGNEALENNLLDPGSLATAKKRGLLDDDHYYQRLRWHGFDRGNAVLIDQLASKLLSPDQLIVGLWRGIFDQAHFEELLKASGIEAWQLPFYKELAHSQPGIQDVIRFAVKDSFNEDVVKDYGYDEDYPAGQIESYAAKQGFDAKTARYFWRAHWNTLSPQQVYDLLHRGLVTQDQADTLLRVADYPKKIRDLLMAASYEPFTRVDIRRMYEVKVLTYNEMIRAYQDIGYNLEKATKLAEFTVKNQQSSGLDLTRADIVQAYVDHARSKDQTFASLIELGFDAGEAGVILDEADAKIKRAAVNDEINFLHEEYVAGLEFEDNVRSKLVGLELSQVQVDTLILRWNREKKVKPKLPSRAEGQHFFENGIITEAEYTFLLVQLGYGLPYTDWFVRAAKLTTKK